jgi:hypothetical protein
MSKRTTYSDDPTCSRSTWTPSAIFYPPMRLYKWATRTSPCRSLCTRLMSSRKSLNPNLNLNLNLCPNLRRRRLLEIARKRHECRHFSVLGILECDASLASRNEWNELRCCNGKCTFVGTRFVCFPIVFRLGNTVYATRLVHLMLCTLFSHRCCNQCWSFDKLIAQPCRA